MICVVACNVIKLLSLIFMSKFIFITVHLHNRSELKKLRVHSCQCMLYFLHYIVLYSFSQFYQINQCIYIVPLKQSFKRSLLLVGSWLHATFETLSANVIVRHFRQKVIPHSWCRRTETALTETCSIRERGTTMSPWSVYHNQAPAPTLWIGIRTSLKYPGSWNYIEEFSFHFVVSFLLLSQWELFIWCAVSGDS